MILLNDTGLIQLPISIHRALYNPNRLSKGGSQPFLHGHYLVGSRPPGCSSTMGQCGDLIDHFKIEGLHSEPKVPDFEQSPNTLLVLSYYFFPC